MPERCIGLPTEPCPGDRCDSTVKFGYGELFLCPECEATRMAQDGYVKTVLPNKLRTKTSTTSVTTRATRSSQKKSTNKDVTANRTAQSIKRTSVYNWCPKKMFAANLATKNQSRQLR